jgi:hypothetical protein
MPNAKGYICNLKCNNKKYREGAFDFLAAYAILEDAWYLVPEKAIRGLGSICLCSAMPKYERYREAWELLKEASVDSHFSEQRGEVGHPKDERGSEDLGASRGPAFARMQAAMNSFRGYLEKGGRQ